MAGVVVSLAVCLLGLLVVYRCLAAWGLRAPGSLARHAVEEGPPAAQGLQPGWKIFLLGAGSRVGLLLAGMAAAMLLSDGGLTWEGAFQQLQRWDAAHYIRLIEEGYQGYTENGQHLFLVFFPGYVWAARLLRLAIPSTALAGMALSCLCYGGACCYLYRLAGEAYNSRVARDALLYMSLFPFSFFFGGMMTESLFLLTTSASLLYIRRHRWAAAGVWGMLAAMTRMHGVLMAAVAMIELFENLKVLEADGRGLKKRIFPVLRQLPFLCLPFLGTGVYLLLNYWVDGNPFAFVIHQQHWHQGFSWFSQTLQYVGENAFAWEDLSTRAAIWIPQLVLFVIFAALLALCWKKLPSMYTLYGFFYLVLNYSLSWLLSAGRYLSCGIPFFLFAALLTEKRPSLDKGLTAAMAALMGVYLFAWLSGAAIY